MLEHRPACYSVALNRLLLSYTRLRLVVYVCCDSKMVWLCAVIYKLRIMTALGAYNWRPWDTGIVRGIGVVSLPENFYMNFFYAESHCIL